MTDFKAKMHQFRFRLGLRPRPRWGSLQRSPRPLAGFGGRFAAGVGAGLGKRRERGWGRGGRGKWRGRKGRAPKLLLNQGPSEPCYATASHPAVLPADNLFTCVARLQKMLGIMCHTPSVP